MSKAELAQQFAQALRLEQTRFIKQQLLAEPNNPYLKQFIHQLYLYSDQILLKDFIQLQALQQVIQKYAFELNLGAGLLEFIGISAQKIHQLTVNNDTPINHVFSDESFELWLSKIVELDQLRHYLQANLVNNPHLNYISLQLANQILESHTPWLDQLRTLKTAHSGIAAQILGFIQEQQQNIELKLEQQLAHALIKQLGQFILLPHLELTEIILQLWQDIKHKTLQEIFSQFQAIDFEEFFVLIYETWRQLRQADYLQQLILDVAAEFYHYFADYSLQALLQSVGLNERDLQQEAQRFLPYTLQTLERQGVLDELLQQLIAPFYCSDNTQQLIAKYLQDQ